jgi:hypothetical protein
MAGGTRNVWAWLEPQAPDELAALQACAARGEWTNGRGGEAIARLRTLAERLGYPVVDPNPPVSPRPVGLVVVRRDQSALFGALMAIARPDVSVVWDRRERDRRASVQAVPEERRGPDRRQLTSPTWETHGFLVA